MKRALYALCLIACEPRELPPSEPVFGDVAPILERGMRYLEEFASPDGQPAGATGDDEAA